MKNSYLAIAHTKADLFLSPPVLSSYKPLEFYSFFNM